MGRGEAQSICFLIPDNESAFENRRLQVMTETNDGFRLAEVDLEERGPGDFLGTRQAGAIDLKMASLADTVLIKQTRELATKLLEEDPDLSQEEHQDLRAAVAAFWPQADGAGDVS